MIHLILCVLLGYFIGAIPFALVIGKLFYKTDVREHGSGNLGGGNTGRVLGKKAGVAVMTLDILKVAFVVLLCRYIGGGAEDAFGVGIGQAGSGVPAPGGLTDLAIALGGIAAGFGHCFPVYAGFRGGKAVAPMYGFLFGLFVFAGRSPLYFFLPLLIFLLVLAATKIISLSSMISAAAVAAFICLRPEAVPIKAAAVIFTILLIVRHRANIVRMLHHKENRISWLG